VTNGGAYNPIVVFTSAVNGTFLVFLFNLARIPFQVFGSIIGVKLILTTFPEIWRGPELVINLHQGALTEGLLTFTHAIGWAYAFDAHITKEHIIVYWLAPIEATLLGVRQSPDPETIVKPQPDHDNNTASLRILLVTADRKLTPKSYGQISSGPCEVMDVVAELERVLGPRCCFLKPKSDVMLSLADNI
nr:probable aquaporin SIP2-1 [Tanacetum cinerariifolium]